MLFVALHSANAYSSLTKLGKSTQWMFFNIDDELVGLHLPNNLGSFMTHGCDEGKVTDNSILQIYEPFATDFGPLNMGSTYRFCEKARGFLQASLSLVRTGGSSIILVSSCKGVHTASTMLQTHVSYAYAGS